jgi:hypothetical protein
LATRASGDGANLTSQAEGATVMLEAGEQFYYSLQVLDLE